MITLLAATLMSSPALAGGDCHKAAETTAAVSSEATTGETVTLNIAGMCSYSCDKVAENLRGTEGVMAVDVSHETGKAEIVIDASKTNADALAKMVTESGYTAEVAADDNS